MSDRSCSKCGAAMGVLDVVCAKCGGSAASILEPGKPAAEASDLPALRPTPSPELLTHESQPTAPHGVSLQESYSFTTSFTSVSSAGGGVERHTDFRLALRLPQEVVDPERRLAPQDYDRLMDAWSEEIAREIGRVSEAGGKATPAEASARIGLPFSQAGVGNLLSPAEQQTMTARAQAAAAQVLSMTDAFTQAEGLAGISLAPTMLPPTTVTILPEITPRRAGFRIGCSTAVVLLAVAAARVGLCWFCQ